jgi:hypothetical protein
MISTIAQFNGVDIDLAVSIAETESYFDENAVRFEAGWKYVFNCDGYAKASRISEDTERVLQMCSWGMMQVMGTVARELGFRGNLLELTKPELGVKFGCLKLKELMGKYSYSDDLIAAYNAGTPRKVDGKYSNETYVAKVRGLYAARKSKSFTKP